MRDQKLKDMLNKNKENQSFDSTQDSCNQEEFQLATDQPKVNNHLSIGEKLKRGLAFLTLLNRLPHLDERGSFQTQIKRTPLRTKIRLKYYDMTYFLHMRQRGFHDSLYMRSQTYKSWNDTPYSNHVHQATLFAFILSFIIFTLAQFYFPYLFLKPKEALAGANFITWTDEAHWKTNTFAGDINNKGANDWTTTRANIDETALAAGDVKLADPEEFLALAGGESHSLAVKTDGTLWAWGQNSSGQVGDGTTTNVTTGPKQIGTDTNWKMVTGGKSHSLAVKTDGTLWAWGYNSYGQVGDGTTTNVTTGPKQIGTATNWKMVAAGAAGGNYSLAVKTDGTLWAWGYNGQGQVGDGTTTNVTTGPKQIGTATNWKMVAAEDNCSLAVKTDGTLWAWGGNYYGQVGDGTTTNVTTGPKQIGTATNWKMVAAGDFHSLAIKTDGTLWAWGYNGQGQVGDGTTTNVTTGPKQIGTATNWKGIAVVYSSPGTIGATGTPPVGLRIDAGTGKKAKWSKIRWNVPSKPANTDIKVWIKTSDTDWGGTYTATSQSLALGDNLTEGDNDPVVIDIPTVWPAVVASQRLEIKVELTSSDGANTPTLSDLKIEYDTISTPTNPKQYRSDSGAEITTGNYTNQSTANLKADVTDAVDNPSTLIPQIEMNTTGSFTGTPGTPSGVTYTASNVSYTGSPISQASIGSVSGLSAGNTYYWKVRYTDASGRASGWSTSNNFKIDQTAPGATTFILKGNGTGSENYINQTSDYSMAKATITLSDNISTSLDVQFSNDGTTWGIYDGTANGAGSNVTTGGATWTAGTYLTVTGITSTPTVTNVNTAGNNGVWKLTGDGVGKTVYCRVRDGAGNVKSAITGSPTYSVAASADDTYAYNNGAWNNASQSLFFGNSAGYLGRAFIRWQINIPSGATINSAYIKLVANESDTSSFTSYIKLLDENNCVAFTSWPYNRAVTSGSVSWSLSPWTAGTEYTSPNISTCVQEFINRAGYASGNYIGLRLDEGNAGVGVLKYPAPYDNTTYAEPKLVVDWATPITDTITLDTAGPTITDLQAGDDTWRSTNNGTYNVDFSDSTSQLSKFQTKICTQTGQGGTVKQDWTDVVTGINNTSYTTNWALLSSTWTAMNVDGTYYVSVKAFDNAGNTQETSDVFYVKKDTQAPTITNNQTGDDTWRSTNNGTYDVDFSDTGSLLSYFQTKVTTAPLEGGTIKQDWTTVVSGINAATYDTNWSLLASTWTAMDTSGTYYVSVRAYDSLNQVSSVTQDAFYVKKDIDLPSSSVTIPASGCTPSPCSYGGPSAAVPWPGYTQGTASDTGGSGVSQVQVQIQTGSSYWDGTDPNKWDGDSNSWIDASNVSGNWQYNIAYTDFVDGSTYTVRYRSIDGAGNVQSSPSSQDFLFDTSAPNNGTFVINSGNPTYTTNANVSLFFSNVNNDVRAIPEYTGTNGGLRISNDGTFDTEQWESYDPVTGRRDNWSLTSSDGSKQVWIQWRDRAGNVSTVTITDTIILDATATTSAVGSPSNGSIINLVTQITGTATDATSGITNASQITIAIIKNVSGTDNYWTGAIWTTTQTWLPVDQIAGTKPNYTWTRNTALPDDWANEIEKDYTIKVKAQDDATNPGTESPITFSYDKVNPSTPSVTCSTHPAEATWYNTNNVTISDFSSTDTYGVAGYSYAWTQAGTDPDDVLDAGAPVSYNSQADGLWHFKVKAKDNAGNWSATKDFNVRIDTTGPTSNNISVNGFDDTVIRITWSPFADDNAGVKEYRIYRSTAHATPESTSTTDPTASLVPPGEPRPAYDTYIASVNADTNAFSWQENLPTGQDAGDWNTSNPGQYTLSDKVYDTTPPQGGWFYYKIIAVDNAQTENTSAASYDHSKTNSAPDPINNFKVNASAGPITIGPSDSKTVTLSWTTTDPDHNPPTESDIVTVKYTVIKPDGSTVHATSNITCPNGNCSGIANGYSVSGVQYTFGAGDAYGNYTIKATTLDTIGTGTHVVDSNVVTVELTPDKPTGVSATSGRSSRIDTNTAASPWTDPNAGAGVASYKVYRHTSDLGSDDSVWRATATNVYSGTNKYYQDNSVSQAVAYYYKVAVVDQSDNEGLLSDVTSATPPKAAAPVNVRLTDNSQTTSTPPNYRIFVSWDEVTAASVPDRVGYVVYRSTDGVIYNYLTTITNISANYYLDEAVTNANTYWYQIRTYDGSYSPVDGAVHQGIGDPSGASNPESMQPGAAGDTSPPVITFDKTSPSDLSKTATSITVHWTTNENADSIVDWGTTSALGNSVGYSTAVTDHTVTITGLTQNTLYYFIIKSTDGSGNTATKKDTGDVPFTVTTDPDTSAPANPTSISAWDSDAKNTTLSSGNWYSYASPRFEWSGASDSESNIAGYYIYFGTNASADPTSYQAEASPNSYTASGLSSGDTYYLRVKTKNDANLESSAITLFAYKYDATAPTSEVASSTNNAKLKALTSITGTASDAHSNVGTVTISVKRNSDNYYLNASNQFVDNGGTPIWLTATGAGIWSYDTSGVTWVNGDYTIQSKASDSVGNTESPTASVTFTFDTTAPTISRAILVSGSASTHSKLHQGDTYRVYAYVSDSSGLSSVISNVAVALNVLTTGSTNVALNSISETTIDGLTYNFRSDALTSDASISAGAKTFYVDAADNATNNADQFSGSVEVENTAPTFTNFGVSSSPVKQGTVVDITFTSSETLGANPTVTVNGHAASYSSNTGLNYTYAYTIQSSDNDGYARIVVSGRDTSGNLSDDSVNVNTTELLVDNTAPNAPTVDSVTSPVNGDAQTITGIAEANSLIKVTRGASEWTQQLSGGATAFSIVVPLDQDSTNNFNVTARDAAGNESLQASFSIVEDSTNPNNFALISPADNADLNTAYPTFRWSYQGDNTGGAGLSHYRLIITKPDLTTLEYNSIDATTYTTPGEEVAKQIESGDALTSGAYTWKVIAVDKAGNFVETSSGTINVAIDLTKPQIVISDPTYGSYIKGAAYAITGSASRSDANKSALDLAQVSINNGAWTNAGSLTQADTNLWNFSYSWTLGSDGIYTIRARAKNTAGTYSEPSDPIAVTVDNTAPSISSGPQAVDITTNSTHISFTTNEVVSSIVEYGLDTSYGSTVTDTNYTDVYKLRLSGLSHSTTYHYRVKVTDRAGNETVSTDYTFATEVVDISPPVITNIQKDPGFASAVIAWATDEPATSQIEYADNPSFTGSATTTLDTNLNRDHSVTITGLTHNTTYYFKIKSKDNLDNEQITDGSDSFTTTRIPAILSASVVAQEQPATNSIRIAWDSDELTTSYVEYGLTASYGNVVGKDDLVQQNHTIDIYDIMPFQTYHYRVKGVNAQSNEIVSSDRTFSTNFIDNVAPSITFNPNVNVSVGVSSAAVNWTTNENADSIVEYRKEGDAEYRTLSGDPKLVTTHTANLKSLSPSTKYYFKIKSKDAATNTTTSSEFSFTTYSLGISTPSASTTATSATIKWTTNVASSSQVEYQKQYSTTPSKIEGSANPTTSHSVTIKDLSSGLYTYKVRSIDPDNNIAESDFLTFEIPTADLGFLGTPSAGQIEEEEITATSAKITWISTVPTTSWVDYGTRSGVYTMSAGNDDLNTSHVVQLTNLVPETTYYYIVRGKDRNGIEYISAEFSFVAISKPTISNIKVTDVSYYAATVTFTTSTKTDTGVNYGKTTAYGLKTGSPDLTKDHKVVLTNLEDNATYHFFVEVKDKAGNLAQSEDRTFTTPLDTTGPQIKDVKIEILPLGTEDETAQVIISYSTNKPSTTLIEYDEGIISGKYGKKTTEDQSLNTAHTVIIKDLNPSTTYHFHIVSKDKRANQTTSKDYTFVTPAKEKSILQLIIRALEETFSWVKNIGKYFRQLGERIAGR